MRSNANVYVKKDKCYVCGTCVERCIMDNLRMFLSPCRQACPLHTNCQGYVRLIAQGKEEEAARELRKYLPFAGIVGRVCTHPCEAKCERRKEDGQPIHIRALKRYLADRYPAILSEPAPAAKATGKRVAVVGSGPAGLMAAYELAARGHAVTAFDSAPEPGGMLRFGIPAYRLPADEVIEAIAMLERMDVKFETGRCLGKDLDAEKLESEWDAVLLAMGLGSALRLGIAGEELPGVYQGLDLLRDIRCGKNREIGQSVIVIGGGNTAIDAAVSCRRLGARQVTMICLEEKGHMPAFPSEIADALEEGVEIQNGYGPRQFIRHTDEMLRVGLSRCLRLFDDEGRFRPVLDASCELSPPVHSIVVAIGQELRREGIPADLFGPAASRLEADPLTLQTKRRKLFAAGDIVTGASSVIEAMAQGREAAISIDRLLAGDTLEWGRAYGEGSCVTHFPIDHKGAIVRSRAALPRLPTSSRNIRYEIEKTMDAKTAREEAERCLSCGHPGEVNETCWYCLPCEIECPAEALEVRIPYLVR